jgi:hypothetical protein
MKENRPDYVNINEECPNWEDRVNMLFKIENGKLYRNMIHLKYFNIRREFYRWIDLCKHPIELSSTSFSKVVYDTCEVLFYLHYGYKAKRLFVMNNDRTPKLEDIKDFGNKPFLQNIYKNKKGEITIEYLNQCLYLVGEELYYNCRPIWHFKTYPAYIRWNKEYAHKNVDDFLFINHDGYEMVNVPPFTVQKHRAKMQLKVQRMLDPKDEVIDHINRNKRDNSFDNLRITTSKINACNVGKQVSSIIKYKSKYKGVSKDSETNWRTRIYFEGNQITIGRFTTEIEAAKAYDLFITDNKLGNIRNKDLGLL